MILLRFFNSEVFEEHTTASSEAIALKTARNALRLLMMGWRTDWKKILSYQVVKAIFFNRDRLLVNAMRLAFQEGFDNLFEQLKEKQLTEEELQQVHFYLANCLSLLPFSDITPYEYFVIPQYIDNQWHQVHYKVTPIELTPEKGFERLFINDEDRVFAYGLEPIFNRPAESHLIFMGTTYPAGQGFYTQIFTDLEAFNTPGNYLFRHSYQKIEQWVDIQQKVHVCGMSLGGSLALLASIYMGEKFSRVDALNPAGLYNHWHASQFDRWEIQEQKPKVYVQKQGNDPVSAFGVWKEQWNLVHVIPPKEAQGPNPFVDHALNYAGFSGTQFKKLNTSEDNKEREQRNFWLFSLARSFLFYTVVAPFRYALLPCARYLLNHKLLITGTILAVGLSLLLSFTVPAFLGAVLLLGALTPLTVNLVYVLYQMFKTCFGVKELEKVKMHDPNLLRNETMDIYKTIVNDVFSNQEINDYNRAQIMLGNNHIYSTDHSDSQKNISASIATIIDMRTKGRIMNHYSFYDSTADTLRDKELQEQEANHQQGIISML